MKLLKFLRLINSAETGEMPANNERSASEKQMLLDVPLCSSKPGALRRDCEIISTY